jgi:RNA-binding protein YhbY
MTRNIYFNEKADALLLRLAKKHKMAMSEVIGHALILFDNKENTKKMNIDEIIESLKELQMSES